LILPDKREFGWKLKPVESARTTFQKLPTGQYELTIKHDLIKNVSKDMVIWWFRKFPNLKVTVRGNEYPAYHLWHPYDHISADQLTGSKNDGVKEGDFLEIHEAFQRNMKFELHDKAKVGYFREDGFGLEVKKGPFKVGKLRHTFRDVEGGLEYNSHMLAGVKSGLMRKLVNSRVLPRIMSEEKLEAWFTHNVEEVGCFENFLPDLFARRSQGSHIDLDR